ncbi:uncharacterized protein LOC135293399 [Passer domesticus]|uniref:uncharacterized protein LOC135293399 n=1 Tax=Passer domesticus TaxID=48849 RepID=UPI0030FE5C82
MGSDTRRPPGAGGGSRDDSQGAAAGGRGVWGGGSAEHLLPAGRAAGERSQRSVERERVEPGCKPVVMDGVAGRPEGAVPAAAAMRWRRSSAVCGDSPGREREPGKGAAAPRCLPAPLRGCGNRANGSEVSQQNGGRTLATTAWREHRGCSSALPVLRVAPRTCGGCRSENPPSLQRVVIAGAVHFLLILSPQAASSHMLPQKRQFPWALWHSVFW